MSFVRTLHHLYLTRRDARGVCVRSVVTFPGMLVQYIGMTGLAQHYQIACRNPVEMSPTPSQKCAVIKHNGEYLAVKPESIVKTDRRYYAFDVGKGVFLPLLETDLTEYSEDGDDADKAIPMQEAMTKLASLPKGFGPYDLLYKKNGDGYQPVAFNEARHGNVWVESEIVKTLPRRFI